MEITVAELISKFIRFGVVGFSGLLIDFGFTYLFKDKLKVNKYAANIIGFGIAVCSNFILNKFWTFEDSSGTYFVQFSLFFGIALVGLLINQSILFATHEYFKIRFYFAKVFAIGVVTLWNFGLNFFFTFDA